MHEIRRFDREPDRHGILCYMFWGNAFLHVGWYVMFNCPSFGFQIVLHVTGLAMNNSRVQGFSGFWVMRFPCTDKLESLGGTSPSQLCSLVLKNISVCPDIFFGWETGLSSFNLALIVWSFSVHINTKREVSKVCLGVLQGTAVDVSISSLYSSEICEFIFSTQS